MFDNNSDNIILYKIGFKGNGTKHDIYHVLIALLICWLPLAVICLFKGTFWTGDITNSFITDFDLQARLFVSMPIFILAERSVSKRLSLILNQFSTSGIVNKNLKSHFDNIIQTNLCFLRSRWTDGAIIILCYVQLFVVYNYESTSTSVLTWQLLSNGGEESLNLAGYWSALVSVPFVLFLVYRWLLRILIWGKILYSISRLEIDLFPFHPDLSGGLGYLGYSIRYFSPIALAFSAIVAGNVADFMLIEGVHLTDLKFVLIGYFIFITILFMFPLLFFTQKLFDERERSVYENYDFINGLYREFRKKISKDFEDVTSEDLKAPDYSAVGDLNAVIENALKMKSMPFVLKDLFPLWIMTATPFLGVVLIEMPVNEIVAGVVSLLF